MFVLWSSPNRAPIKSMGPVKKTSHLRPIYLRSNLATSKGLLYLGAVQVVY